MEGNSSSAPDLLQEVKVPVISNAQCVSDFECIGGDSQCVSDLECFEAEYNIRQNNLCAGFPEGGKDFCKNDDGGPGVFFNSDGRAYHIGVVSYGVGGLVIPVFTPGRKFPTYPMTSKSTFFRIFSWSF